MAYSAHSRRYWDDRHFVVKAMNMRFPTNTDWKNALIYSLVCLCGSLLAFISSLPAQACTPVVYAFRHAEDLEAPSNGLTLVGQQHAFLYPAMVADFGAANDYCPVAFVYSTYDINPDKGQGTNNPYETARPLAVAACYNFPNVSSQSLATCNFFPRTALENGGKLYEYLGASKSEQGTPLAGISATGPQLLNELIDKVQTGGVSVAIFWTSQGLNILGQAIVPGFTGIPGCSKLPATDECKKLKAPRNAAYVFAFNGSGFKPPDAITQYVQCFNVHVDFTASPSKIVGPGEATYYCGNEDDGTGSLPSISEREGLDSLLGKICDTSSLIASGPRGYYGYCR
jgi:hypothetical protein